MATFSHYGPPGAVKQWFVDLLRIPESGTHPVTDEAQECACGWCGWLGVTSMFQEQVVLGSMSSA
jgi:hypothetical protein